MRKQGQFNELFKRYEGNPILTAHSWPYTAHTVFNPAATIFNNKTLLLVRVEDKRGFSHLTMASSEDGITNWEIDSIPTLQPDPENYPEEIWGIEDPRITYLEETGDWAITYTAYSQGGPLVSLALTRDFKNFDKLGPIMPPEDKDAALFPRKFRGRWALLHRPMPAYQSIGAHIWLSYSPDLRYWGDHQILFKARRGGWWDANKIGLSPQPMETTEGWLVLYHGVRQTAGGVIYRLGIALLDLENPGRVLHRGDEWIFGPHEEYEREGDVDDVVFPCGWVHDPETDQVRLYYGGADSVIAVATTQMADLLEYIKRCPECDA